MWRRLGGNPLPRIVAQTERHPSETDNFGTLPEGQKQADEPPSAYNAPAGTPRSPTGLRCGGSLFAVGGRGCIPGLWGVGHGGLAEDGPDDLAGGWHHRRTRGGGPAQEFFADGRIDDTELEFLLELRHSAKSVKASFNLLVLEALKNCILANGTIARPRWPAAPLDLRRRQGGRRREALPARTEGVGQTTEQGVQGSLQPVHGDLSVPLSAIEAGGRDAAVVGGTGRQRTETQQRTSRRCIASQTPTGSHGEGCRGGAETAGQTRADPQGGAPVG